MTILSYVSAEADLTVGYVYKWTNLVNGMMYIGKHNGNNPDYIGSGVAFKAAVKEYGIENFQREMLYIGPNFSEIEEEILIAVDARQSPNFYNRVNIAGEGSLGTLHTEESKAERSHRMSGENNPMYGCFGELNPFFGRNHTFETKQKISNSVSGFKHTEEAKSKIREASKGRTHSQESRNKISQRMQGSNYSGHVRWHVNRGLAKEGCIHCTST